VFQWELTLSRGSPINLALKNRLLAALPASARTILLQPAEFVELSLLSRLESPLRHTWFPTTGALAVLAPGSGENTLEISTVTSRGQFGPPVDMPPGSFELSGLVTNAGAAWRLPTRELERVASREPSVRNMLHRSCQATQMIQARSAFCLSHHPLPQRLATWLLTHTDDELSPDLLLTHDNLASLLASKRSSISQALQDFATEKVLVTGRGHIMVTDRSGLASIACTCYAANAHTRARCSGTQADFELPYDMSSA